MSKFLNIILASLLFVVLPLANWPGLPDSFEFPKAIFFNFLFIITIGLKLIGMLPRQRPIVNTAVTHIIISLMVLFQFVSWQVSGGSSAGFWGQYYRYQGLLFYIEISVIFYLISTPFIYLKKIISFSALLNCALIFGQYILYIFNVPVYHFDGRMTAFFGNPNFAAAFLAFAYPFTTRPGRASNVFLFLLFFCSIFLTGSRSGLIALVSVPIVLYPSQRISLRRLPLLFAPLLFLFLLPSRPVSHFDNRLLIWQKSIVAIVQKPLLGWGPENFDLAFTSVLTPSDFDFKNVRVDRAHNLILDTAVNFGLLGLYLLLVIIYLTMSRLYRLRHLSSYAICLSSLIAFLIYSQLNVISLTSFLFFYVLINLSTTPPPMQ